MTAATITTAIRTHDKDHEFVVLTASDGETYTSLKFKNILLAQVSYMEDFGTSMTPVSCDVGTGASSNVVTIQANGVTDKKVALHIVGNLGN